MKKIYILICMLNIISCANNKQIKKESIKKEKYTENEINYININKNDELDFFYSAYTCEYSNEQCKIYFLPPFYNKYILLLDNDKLKKYINVENYNFDSYDNTFSDFSIKYTSNGVYIQEDLKLLKKIEINKVDYDERFLGLFEFNNNIYNIEINQHNNYTQIILKNSDMNMIRGFSSIVLVDTDILMIMDSIFSEYPIYKYQFDNNNNLILEPLVGNYLYVDKIQYKLKRLN